MSTTLSHRPTEANVHGQLCSEFVQNTVNVTPTTQELRGD